MTKHYDDEETTKLTWRVASKPTGAYRSFFRRGWPTAEDKSGNPLFRITCADDYVPSKVKTGDHAELSLWAADWRKNDGSDGGSFTWRRLKARAATLDEAKRIAQRFLDDHPEIFIP